mmetsp:Transcript_8759/g.16303  ORF Transcript_8759/g.16303 Transcript_8759/m.16303 type:complete len:99 (-) Transcript_8759:218-514(-)
MFNSSTLSRNYRKLDEIQQPKNYNPRIQSVHLSLRNLMLTTLQLLSRNHPKLDNDIQPSRDKTEPNNSTNNRFDLLAYRSTTLGLQNSQPSLADTQST